MDDIQLTLKLSELITIVLSLIAIIIALVTLWLTRKQWQLSLNTHRKEINEQRIFKNNAETALFDSEDIKRSTHCYIEPNCSNVDPSREAEPRHLIIIENNIFDAVDKYLSTETPEKNAYHHILILADSGMGKTSFVLNYYVKNKKKKHHQHTIYIVPLGKPNADEFIKNVPNKKEVIIFLDALDEDQQAIQDYHKRIGELMEMCRDFKRVVMTSRTQFFPSDEEIPKDTGIAKVGARSLGDNGAYVFLKLYLSPFSDDQVDAYLKKLYKWRFKERKKAWALIQKINYLKVRPMLLTYIKDIVHKAASNDIKYAYQLYDILIEGWLDRENYYVNKDNLRNFSENLALNLYDNSARRKTERIPGQELKILAEKWNIPLESWQLTGRSLLNRDADGNYKFAHRSIMEYLYVKKFKYHEGIVLTDQMNMFLEEMILSGAIDPQKLPPSLCLFCLKSTSVPIKQKLIAGERLSVFGDPRFLPDAWFLPDDPLFGFIEIPAGKFLMGSSLTDRKAFKNERKQHSLFLETFFIAKYPVTVMQYRTFLEYTGKEVPSNLYNNKHGNHPVVNVNWFEAITYCQWLTKQLKEKNEIAEQVTSLFNTNDWQVMLPSEAEWEKAARGTDGRIYPWGNTFDGNYLNYNATGIGRTCPVGCFEKGASPYHIEEMSGNVWEWTRSTYKNYPYVYDDGREDIKDKNAVRVLRGGRWYYPVRDCRIAYRFRYRPDYRDEIFGFRLCISRGQELKEKETRKRNKKEQTITK